MIPKLKTILLCLAVVCILCKICKSEPHSPYLSLYSPGDAEYMEILVRWEHDNITLVCELRPNKPTRYLWNYLAKDEATQVHIQAEPPGLSYASKIIRKDLQLNDTGQYICSAPPFSVKKFLLVQPRGPKHCTRGAFWCGDRCVLPSYVCDGHHDCKDGRDEQTSLCGENVCGGPDKLNCSGRCIPKSACVCHTTQTLCVTPTCCKEHAYVKEEYLESEFPALFEDRHAPDEYGFIQSTIYTVTACALIFMVAVVLLVSALCKMHMKRSALRSYASQHRDRAQLEVHRYPPCYEASRLLEQVSPSRQVPTQSEVEMQDVRCNSENSSPIRRRDEYQSPNFCDFNASEFYFTTPEAADCGRDLNYMATPMEFFRRRSLTRNLERRPLTLQLGRFQLSIPRFGRSNSDLNRRPDTPNVAEININELDFVRVNSNDTYTLNGRTIRLLGANFENYPSLPNGTPPPYNEAMRLKLYGPPPEYLSRDNITENTRTPENASSNIEMPPRYDEVGNNDINNAVGVSTVSNSDVTVNNNDIFRLDNTDTVNGNSFSDVIDNLPAIDSDVNANEITDG